MRLFVAFALMLAPCAYAVSPGAGADIDVGAPSFAGSGSFNNGVITVTGSGRDISPNSASQYNFYYYKLTGDGSITARVVSLTKTATYAKAGVMIQQSPYPGSGYALAYAIPPGISPQGSVASQINGANPSYLPAKFPVWLRVTRSNGYFSAYSSPDGTNYQLLSGPTPIAMDSVVMAGLVVTSHDAGSVATAVFDNVSLTGQVEVVPDFRISASPTSATLGSSGQTTITVTTSTQNGFSGTVNLSAVGLPAGIGASFSPASVAVPGTSTLTLTGSSSVPSGSYLVVPTGTSGGAVHGANTTLSVSAAVASAPPNARNGYVGTTLAVGSASANNGIVTIQASGGDIAQKNDQFDYYYYGLSGDGSITARLLGPITGKAGVMARETMNASSANIMLAAIPVNGPLGVQWIGRSQTSFTSTILPFVTYPAPIWMRLTRAGNRYTTFTSSDGQFWVPQGPSSQLTNGSNYIGLAATGATTSFDNVSVTGTVVEAPDFAITVTPPAQTVTTGAAAKFTVSAAALGGFTGNITLSVNGVAGNFEPPTISPGGSSILTLPTTGQIGTTTYNVFATGQYLTHAATATVTAVSSTTTASASADTDVGSPSFAGSGNFSNGVITVTGSGRDISPNSASQYNYYYYQLTGDGSITARLVSLTKTSTYAKAGVMMQQQPYPSSSYALAYAIPPGVSPQGSVASQINGSSSAYLPSAFPVWLRVTRSNGYFTAYSSQDGTNYQLLSGPTPITMQSVILAGLVVTSHDPGSVATAVFDNVSFTGQVQAVPDFKISASPASPTLGSSGPTTITVTTSTQNGFSGTVNLSAVGLPAGVVGSFSQASVAVPGTSTLTLTGSGFVPSGNYLVVPTGTNGLAIHGANTTLQVSAAAGSAPPNARNGYVGTTLAVGNASVSNGTVTIQASGGDIAQKSDQFDYYYYGLSGDGSITARLLGPITGKAGVMVRETMDASSANILLSAIPVNGVLGIQWIGRIQTNFTSTILPFVTYPAPIWMRLTRAGNQVAAFTSSDGQFWVPQGPSSQMSNGSNYIGLAATGTTTSFDNVSVTGAVVAAPDFTVTLTPQSQTVPEGTPATYTVSTTALAGFSGTISLSLNGAAGSFSPATLSAGGSSVLTMPTDGILGTRNFVVFATYQNLTHSVAGAFTSQ